MNVRQSATIYFAFQGVAVAAWWSLLLFLPASREYFRMGESEATLLAFWLPDLLLLAAGSLAAAGFCFFDSQLTALAAWFVGGTISYAALYCLVFAFLTDSGWLGVTLMLPAMLWSGGFAVVLSPPIRAAMFRRSKESRTSWILTKTAVQIVIVWTLILFVFPYFILQLEDKIGVLRFGFSFQTVLAILLFGGISLLGLSGAFTMSKIGRGTPLSLDAASRLVVSDIYIFAQSDGGFGHRTGFSRRFVSRLAARSALRADGRPALADGFSSARRSRFAKKFRRRLRRLPFPHELLDSAIDALSTAIRIDMREVFAEVCASSLITENFLSSGV